MPVAVRDLVREASLGLRVCTAPAGLNRIVRWVAVTELGDPSPWMAGGELILTTGLRQRTAAAQTAFVERVAVAGGCGIGFGTGLSHTRVPRATVAEAERHGLAVLEVPYETPFIAINRLVAERVTAEGMSRQRRLVDQHDLLIQALLSGGGLLRLVQTLRTMVKADVAVADAHGMVLAAAPSRAAALVGRVAPGDAAGAATCLPVDVDGEFAARLYVGDAAADPDVLPFATRLVGLEVARRRAELAGRRGLAGQVLEDVIRDLTAPGAAERRLEAVGVLPGREYRVVLGSLAPGEASARDEQQLARLMWAPADLPAGPGGVVSAVVQRHLAALVPAGVEPEAVAHRIATALCAIDPRAAVGIGGAYRGVEGLRWSFFEAQSALDKGPGVHGGDPLNLSRLLLANPDLPLRRLGEEILRPLATFDRDNHGDLVATLYAYLAADCSVQKVAETLFVHRNTVRYRLDQIERLTNRSLQSTQDRVQLWLALLASHRGERRAPDEA
jgi:purine catabolism regulator